MRGEGEGGHGSLPNARFRGGGEIGFCPLPQSYRRGAPSMVFCGAEGASEKILRDIGNFALPSFLSMGFIPPTFSTIAVLAILKKKSVRMKNFRLRDYCFEIRLV